MAKKSFLVTLIESSRSHERAAPLGPLLIPVVYVSLANRHSWKEILFTWSVILLFPSPLLIIALYIVLRQGESFKNELQEDTDTYGRRNTRPDQHR